MRRRATRHSLSRPTDAHCWLLLLPPELLAAIAAENNLSETAFLVPETGGDVDFHLRWFTPTVEVDLCGHATLASGPYLLTPALTARR